MPRINLFHRNSKLTVGSAWQVLETRGLLPSFEKATLRLSPSGYVLYAGFSDRGAMVGFNVNGQLDELTLKSYVQENSNDLRNSSYLNTDITLNVICESIIIGFHQNTVRTVQELQNSCNVVFEAFLNFVTRSTFVRDFNENELRKLIRCVDLTYSGLNADNTLTDFFSTRDAKFNVREQWALDVLKCELDDVRRYAGLLLEGVPKEYISSMWDYPDSWIRRISHNVEVEVFDDPRRYISRHVK